MKTYFKEGRLTEEFLRENRPSQANRKFTVIPLDDASSDTKEILAEQGKEYILKARAHRPSIEKFYLLLRSETTQEAYWLPEDEVLLMVDF